MSKPFDQVLYPYRSPAEKKVEIKRCRDLREQRDILLAAAEDSDDPDVLKAAQTVRQLMAK